MICYLLFNAFNTRCAYSSCILFRLFGIVDNAIFCYIFNAYCLSLYSSRLWGLEYKKMESLHVTQ